VMSDTDMRESIAKGTESEDPNDPHGDKPSGSGRGSKS